MVTFQEFGEVSAQRDRARLECANLVQIIAAAKAGNLNLSRFEIFSDGSWRLHPVDEAAPNGHKPVEVPAQPAKPEPTAPCKAGRLAKK